jgi:hypothetical protein
MDSKHINSKTSPNQMRVLMKRMRDGKYEVNEVQQTKKDLTMRDMLKITRKLNEDIEEQEPTANMATSADLKYLTDNFMNLFNNIKVNIKLLQLDGESKLKLTKDSAFWGGTIDGAIQFAYKITPEENTKEAGIEFNYLPEFSADDPDNQDIIKKIESFYDTFYNYWKDNFQEA